jgi:hypothetical protein
VIVANKIDVAPSLEVSLEQLDAVAQFASKKHVRHHAITATDHTMVMNFFKSFFGEIRATSTEFNQLRVRRQSLPHVDLKGDADLHDDRSHSCILS